MCLAVPGKLIQWLDRDPLLARGLVEFGGVQRECHLACVLEACEGDYLVVHAGIAIGKIDSLQAEQLLAELAALPLEAELSADSPASADSEGEAKT